MEMLQRSETTPNSLQSEINGRLNLQLSHGVSYVKNKHKNDNNNGNASPTTGESTEIDEQDPDEDDDSDQQSLGNCNEENLPQRPMVCGVCHLPSGVTGVAGVPTSPGPMLACTQGHLLCQQCVHRYTVCSDVGCVVCGADIHASTSTYYRTTSSPISCRPIQQLLSGNPHRVQAICNNTRTLGPVQEMERSKNWARNDSEIPGAGGADNGAIFHGGNSRFRTGYNSGWDGDLGDGIQAIQTNTNANSLRQMQRQSSRSYCNVRGGDADLEVEGLRTTSGSCARERNWNGNAALVHSECSRRPIRCPRLDCAVNVAFSALTHHFLFDHPEVPILSVEPGVKSTLIVSFAALSCDSSRCLALLLVSGKVTGTTARLFSGSQIQPRYRNRLPLPVLAARLHCSNQHPCDDESHAHGEGRGKGDIVIAWVAGLDVGGATTEILRCSIQAVDGNDTGELRSLTYSGPVNSLRTAQRPREVFRTGDCVILHQGFIDHVTSGCTSINVNVIVH